MNTKCLSTYCPPRSLLSSYSGTLSNSEITLSFFLFLKNFPSFFFVASLLSLPYPLSETYLYLQPQIRLSPTCPQAERSLSTPSSFLNNYTQHCWFCNFLGLSIYLLIKKEIITAMNLLEFSWKLRWQGVCLETLRSMSEYC